MYLVIHHVFQPLVVSWTNEDLSVQLASCEPIVQNLSERGRGEKGGVVRERGQGEGKRQGRQRELGKVPKWYP